LNRHRLSTWSLPSPTIGPPRGYFDSLARWLIASAAHHAPPTLAARLEEEWLAVLEEHGGTVTRLRHALGCCWATGVIAREHAEAVLTAASPEPQDLLPPRQPSFLLQRTAVALLIVGLHMLAIGALVAGFAWSEIPQNEAEATVYLTYGHSAALPPRSAL
jgi:hypothetical protein